eukprot:261082-Amphidinium_carterae.1
MLGAGPLNVVHLRRHEELCAARFDKLVVRCTVGLPASKQFSNPVCHKNGDVKRLNHLQSLRITSCWLDACST